MPIRFVKYGFYFFAVLLFFACKQQPKFKKGDIYFEEVGWTLNFPKEYNFQNKEQIDSLQKATLKKIDKSKSIDTKIVPYKTLFFILEPNFNGFNSTIEKYDPNEFRYWEDLYNADKISILKAMETQKGNLIIEDSASSVEIIDGIKFQKFYLKTFIPTKDIRMKTYWYATEVNHYNFDINISFVDESKGSEYFKILHNSKFNY